MKIKKHLLASIQILMYENNSHIKNYTLNNKIKSINLFIDLKK